MPYRRWALRQHALFFIKTTINVYFRCIAHKRNIKICAVHAVVYFHLDLLKRRDCLRCPRVLRFPRVLRCPRVFRFPPSFLFL